MTTAVRDYLQSVVNTIEKRHSRRGSTTGKRQWELNLLTGAKLLLAEEQLDLPLATPAPVVTSEAPQ